MEKVTYSNYLKLTDLLSLQSGEEKSRGKSWRDEELFIIVHQISELWFKAMLGKLILARDGLSGVTQSDELLQEATKAMRSAARLFSLSASTLDGLADLDVGAFLEFREHLYPASGSDSFQFRAIEEILGRGEAFGGPTGQAPVSDDTSLAQNGICRKMSLRTALYDWVCRALESFIGTTSIDHQVNDFLRSYCVAIAKYLDCGNKRLYSTILPDSDDTVRMNKAGAEAVERCLFAFDVENNRRRAFRRLRAGLLLIESYPSIPSFDKARALVTAATELEEGLLLWRFHHTALAERLIGGRRGTGGSLGSHHLERTLFHRVFDELAAIRTYILPQRHVPTLNFRQEHSDTDTRL